LFIEIQMITNLNQPATLAQELRADLLSKLACYKYQNHLRVVFSIK